MVDKALQQAPMRNQVALIGALAAQQRLSFPSQKFFKAVMAFQVTPASTTALLSHSHPNAGGSALRLLSHYSSATEIL